MKAWFLRTLIVLLWLEGFHSKAPHFLRPFKSSSSKQSLDPSEWVNVTNAWLNSYADTQAETSLQLNQLYFPEKIWLEAFKPHHNEGSNEVSPQLPRRETLVRLDLSCNGFNQHHYRIIAPVLSSFPNLQEVIFDSCPLDENAFRILVHAFRKMSNLTSLSLSHCSLKDTSMYLLHSLLHGSNSSQLKHLDLSRNGITITGLQSLFPLSSNEKGKKRVSPLSLETLDLSYNELEDKGIEYLCQIIDNNHLPLLRHLILKEVKCSDCGTLKLLETLTRTCEESHFKLVSLDISGNPLVPAKTKLVGKKSKLLKIYETNSALLSNAMKATVSTFSQAYTRESSPQSIRYPNKKSKRNRSNKHIAKSSAKKSAAPTSNKPEVKSQQSDYYKAAKILLHFLSAAKDLQFFILRKTNLQSSFLQLLEKVYTKEHGNKSSITSEEKVIKRCDLGSNDLTSLEKSSFLSIVNNSPI